MQIRFLNKFGMVVAFVLFVLAFSSICQAQQAQQAQYPDNGTGKQYDKSAWTAAVVYKIRAYTLFPDPKKLPDNTPVEYSVDLNPDGSVRNVVKIKTSNLPAFDLAVRNAIEKAQPYPADKSGQVPSQFILVSHPTDR